MFCFLRFEFAFLSNISTGAPVRCLSFSSGRSEVSKMASLDTNWSDVADDSIPAIPHDPDGDFKYLPLMDSG